MTTMLTLIVEKGVIRKAKAYARKRKLNLSEIVAGYLSSLTADEDAPEEIDEEVMALADNIPAGSIPDLDDPRYRYLKSLSSQEAPGISRGEQ
jgi:hypothetical protein